MKYQNIYFLLVLITLLQACSLAEWQDIEEYESINIIRYNFYYTEDMKIVSGQSFCGDVIDGDSCIGNTEYEILFTLPDTMSPNDWLEFLVIQAANTEIWLDFLNTLNARYADESFIRKSDGSYERKVTGARTDKIEYQMNRNIYVFSTIS